MATTSKDAYFANFIVKRQYDKLMENGFTSKDSNFNNFRDCLSYLYDEHVKHSKSKMRTPKDELDKHRQAACITASVLDAQIMVPAAGGSAEDAMLYYPDEILAALSAISHIHFSMAKSFENIVNQTLAVADFVRFF